MNCTGTVWGECSAVVGTRDRRLPGTGREPTVWPCERSWREEAPASRRSETTSLARECGFSGITAIACSLFCPHCLSLRISIVSACPLQDWGFRMNCTSARRIGVLSPARSKSSTPFEIPSGSPVRVPLNRQ
jgi:hypothetical protein